jgi:glycosyltransferase involved in cell wall biosynthesis
MKRLGVYNGDIHQWLIDFCGELGRNAKVYLFGAGNTNLYPYDSYLSHLDQYSYKILTIPGRKPYPSPKLFLNLARSRCDEVVILTVESLPALVFYFLSWFLGAQRLLIIESNNPDSTNAWDSIIARIKKPLISVMYKTANRLVAESSASADYLHREFQVPMSRVFMLPHGVKTSRFRRRDQTLMPRNHKCVLLYAGALVERKGADFFVEAIDILVSDFGLRDDILVKMRKGGPLMNNAEFARKMRSLIRLGVIEPFPDLSFEEMAELHLSADIVVVPSRLMEHGSSDPSPNTLLEALACGKPIITTPVGGIPSIAKDAVLYVEPNNSQSLALGIRALLKDTALRDSLARKAWSRGTELDMSTYSLKILQLLGS